MAFEELLNALNGLSGQHEELLQLAREKQDHIIHNRVDQLVSITAKENKAVAAIEQSAQQLGRQTAKCWMDLEIAPQPGSTLADLMRAVPEAEWKTRIGEAAERLKTAIRSLKELNERNQELVRHSLDYVAFAIDLLKDPYEEITYTNGPSPNGGMPRRTFETRA